MTKIFQAVLNTLAQFYVWRYRPMIVAVTGNTGKTSVKEAIAAVLRANKKIRVSEGNLNNEWGIPLTILGDWSGEYYDRGGTLGLWLKVLGRGLVDWLKPGYPEVLVLEYGADRPGDISRLARKFRPHIAVITAIGEIPVHVEYFSGPQAVAQEKSELVRHLLPTGWAVLNIDDPAVVEMKNYTRAKIMTFGFLPEADIRISGFDFKVNLQNRPEGVTFKLHQGESFVPVRVEGSLGKSQAWAAAAAAAVGSILGMNLVTVSEMLSKHRGPAGRLKIIPGIKNSTIIDDTYNASPASTHLALDTLKVLPAKRKIAVLGDMLELGEYSTKAHEAVGNQAGTIVNWLITVGARAKFIADAAANQMSPERIFSFSLAAQAGQKLQELIEEGELILIKASQGMRLEKVTEEVMAEPQKKKELLVRQSKKWLNK